MPPKLRSDDGLSNVVIRPLTYCREKDRSNTQNISSLQLFLVTFVVHKRIYSVKVLKQCWIDWDKKTPGRVDAIFKSIQNISPSQLADKELV